MKNNMLQRLLCFIFALAIAVSTLGACSTTEEQENPSSNLSSEDVSSNEPDNNDPSSDETITEEPVEDDWYDGLEEDNSDQFDDYDDMLSTTLNIYNDKAVQDDFMGFGGVYHAFPFRSDMYGRQYDERMAKAEIQRAINSGISIARSHYEIPSAWDETKKCWDWESEEMQAIYKFCLELKKGDVDVLINHWYSSNFLFTTYPWSNATPEGQTNKGHEAIAVPGNQQATLENFATFMSETVKQLHAHGCTNVTTISIATEPYAYWSPDWEGIVTEEEIKEAAAKDMAYALNAVNKQLKKDGIRDSVDVMGPNFAGQEDAAMYLRYFNKYADSDSCDLISLHKYYGNDLTADNYYMWQECAEIYKQETSFKNFVWDEYNSSPPTDKSISNRHDAYNGVQLALAQICFLNYGMRGSFVWSLFDQQWPNNTTTSTDFVDGLHMLGLAPSFLKDSFVYPPYYEFALVANALGDKGSKVYRGDDDTYEGVYAAMTENKEGELSIIVVSTNIEETSVKLNFKKNLGGRSFYRHVYNPNDVLRTEEADLIKPDLELTNTTTTLNDVVEPYCVVVYTTKQICE